MLNILRYCDLILIENTNSFVVYTSAVIKRMFLF